MYRSDTPRDPVRRMLAQHSMRHDLSPPFRHPRDGSVASLSVIPVSCSRPRCRRLCVVTTGGSPLELLPKRSIHTMQRPGVPTHIATMGGTVYAVRNIPNCT